MADPSAERPDHRELLLAFLADGSSACPRCRHRLGGLSAPVCPECGAELTLEVGAARRSLGAWSTAMSALLGGSGFGLVLVIIAILRPHALFAHPIDRLSTLCGFVCIPLAVLVIAFRWLFVRLPAVWQWVLAGGSVLLVIVEYGGFIVRSIAP